MRSRRSASEFGRQFPSCLASIVFALMCSCCLLGGCQSGGGGPTPLPQPLALEWKAGGSYTVGDTSSYSVTATNSSEPLVWTVQGLPYSWTTSSAASSWGMTGPMMLGSTNQRTVVVTAKEPTSGRDAEIEVIVVANRYVMQVPTNFERPCGIGGGRDQLCYTTQLPVGFKRDPDRSGHWDAWIDTAELLPGDELSVFDFAPTKFESEKRSISPDVRVTKAGTVDTGESTQSQSSTAALSAIEDGLIRVRIKATREQDYTIAKVEFHVY